MEPSPETYPFNNPKINSSGALNASFGTNLLYEPLPTNFFKNLVKTIEVPVMVIVLFFPVVVLSFS